MSGLDHPQQDKKQQPPGSLPDLVDQAVQSEVVRHNQDVRGRTWLAGIAHTVTDPITHALGMADSDQTLSSLRRLQDEYHQDLSRGAGTGQVKTEIFSEIAKDQSAQRREDTDAGYGAEFLKAAALFAPPSISPLAAGGVFALDQTNNLDSGAGWLNLGLGFGKGFGLSKLYGKIGQTNWSVPMQGAALGFASRGLDLATDLNTYKDRQGNFSLSAAGSNFGSLLNLQSIATDAAVFTAANGLFHIANANGVLESGRAAKMFTAGSFGLVSDATGEAQRQIQHSGTVKDWGAVVEHGIVGGAVNAAGGGLTTAPEVAAVNAARTDGAGNPINKPHTSMRELDLSEAQARRLDPEFASGRERTVQHNGGSFTVADNRITSMTDAGGHRFQYDYARTSDIHPQSIVFPDGSRAQRVVDAPTPVWHEFDPAGNRTQVHNDVYKVLADGSLMRYNEDDNYRAVTRRPDGGIATASGVEEEVRMPDGRSFVHPSPMFLVTSGVVSPEIRAEVENTLQSMPLPYREAMQRQGQKVILGQSLLKVRPNLASKELLGHKGENWSMLEGAFDGDVLLGEKIQTKDGVRSTYRISGVLRHEGSHGLNVALGKDGVALSDTPEFKQAHAQDMAQMDAGAREQLKYLLQVDRRGRATAQGRNEAFAELSGISLGGGSAPSLRTEILTAFPRTYQVVQGKLTDYLKAHPPAQQPVATISGA